MSSSTPHILFSGGITGGHLFPGLAVAEQLRQRWPKFRITFAGSGRAFERQQVFDAGFEYVGIRSQPLPRRILSVGSFLRDNLLGMRKASRVLQEQNVSLVVGLGGYASVPAARAAARHNIPLVLLEQNAYPGRATRYLASSASLICLAMGAAHHHLRGHAAIQITGNPLRSGFDTNTLPFSPQTKSAKRLLVLGGSGGAQELNETVPRALYKCRKQLAGWEILHQSGSSGQHATESLYRKFELPGTVTEFIEDIPSTLQHTDLAVTRAGGTTLAELAASGVPAVLWPMAKATDDHQRKNAAIFATLHAARLFDSQINPGRLDTQLAEQLSPLLSDAALREESSAAMHRIARPDAARQVAQLIREMLLSQSRAAAA